MEKPTLAVAKCSPWMLLRIHRLSHQTTAASRIFLATARLSRLFSCICQLFANHTFICTVGPTCLCFSTAVAVAGRLTTYRLLLKTGAGRLGGKMSQYMSVKTVLLKTAYRPFYLPHLTRYYMHSHNLHELLCDSQDGNIIMILIISSSLPQG